MAKTKEYKVIASTKIQCLVDEVNKALNDGWECVGGVAVERTGYRQAMVREHGNGGNSGG